MAALFNLGQARTSRPAHRGQSTSCLRHMCQRHSGAPALAWVGYRPGAVDLIGPEVGPVAHRASDPFCSTLRPMCGSTLGAIDGAPIIGLAGGACDRPNLRALAAVCHSCRGLRPIWWHFGKGRLENPES